MMSRRSSAHRGVDTRAIGRAVAVAIAGTALGVVPVAVVAQAQPDYRCDPFVMPHYLSERMATGKDGSVWFPDRSDNRIIRMTRSHAITSVVPAKSSDSESLYGITVAPDGAVWYSKDKPATLGRIPPGGGKPVEYALPAPGIFRDGDRRGARRADLVRRSRRK